MALRASYYGLKKRILEKVLGDYDAAGVMTNKELTDEVENLSSGLIDALKLQVTYGSVNPINIDTIDNEKGYMYRCTTSTGLTGAAPTDLGNTFILWGLSKIINSLPQYGVQVAIGIGADKIAFRRAPYNVSGAEWPVWKYISVS